MMNQLMLDEIILTALKEDLGTGDITTLSTVPKEKVVSGKFIAKEAGTICGLDVVKRVFVLLDPAVKLDFFVGEGMKAEERQVFGEISGPAQSILSGERVALNFMQRMSGIATSTKQYVKQVEGTGAKITDTRKTTPGLRMLEKYAVRIGGGVSHRYNLSDGVMIKDNHIQAAGGIQAAIEAARKHIPHTLKIEVEVENLQQLSEALEAGADIIMLDNMSIEKMKMAVNMVAGKALTEASGNMGEKDLKQIAATGVNYISIGALTHTIRALDISLRF